MDNRENGLNESVVSELASKMVNDFVATLENPVEVITKSLGEIYSERSLSDMVGYDDHLITDELIELAAKHGPNGTTYIDEEKFKKALEEIIPDQARSMVLDYLESEAYKIMPDYDELPDNIDYNDLANEIGKILLNFVDADYFEELVKAKTESLGKLFKATLEYATSPVPEYKGSNTEGEA